METHYSIVPALLCDIKLNLMPFIAKAYCTPSVKHILAPDLLVLSASPGKKRIDGDVFLSGTQCYPCLEWLISFVTAIMSGFPGACVPFPAFQEINSWIPTHGLDALYCDTIHVCMHECVCECVNGHVFSVWVILQNVFTFILVYTFSPPTVTVSKSLELSFRYYTEREGVSELVQAGSPCGLPTCRKALLHSFCCRPGMVFDRINMVQPLISKQWLPFQMVART